MRGKTFAYPATIDLDKLVHQFSVDAPPKQFQKYRDAFAFIIGSIYYKTLRNKDEQDDFDEDEDEQEVRLSSTLLAGILGNKYSEYLNFLLKHDVICKTAEYSTFTIIHTCRAYAISKRRINIDHQVKWHTLQDENKSARIQEVFNKHTTPAILSILKSYKYVTRYLDEEGLKIDEGGAITKLNEVLVDDLKHELLGSYDKKITPYEKFIYNKSKVLNFNDSISSYIVDNSGYRLHTALVRLPKYLRKYVKYKGQHLISLDLKNSQPFLLCALFNKKLWNSSATLCVQKLYSELYNNIHELTTIQRTKIIYWKVFSEVEAQLLRKALGRSSIISIVEMLSTLLENPISNRLQDPNFKSLCESGTLYEVIGELFKGKYFINGVDQYGTRDMVKLQIMRLFFGGKKKTKIWQAKELSAFMEKFPEIGNLLLLLKSDGYKKCPCLLQRLESHLMLKEVATEIYRRKIPTPVFTVHDSIVVLPEFADEVQQIMSDTIFIKTGMRPKIKPDKWE